jgi:RNA polymerase sigma-70 factor, ECF subfamily
MVRPTGAPRPAPPHTYGYKFLHKTALADIIGLRLLTTLGHHPDWRPAAFRGIEGAPVADTRRDIEAEIPRLRRYARALTRDIVVADDLVQDCLTRALGKLHLWQEGSDLRAWLFTILHNQYVNHIRRAVREGATVGLNENEPLLRRAPQQSKRLELRDLERAIAKLPGEQRVVILLVGLEGMRYEEVAAILDVPVGTIRSRLSRGREALRRLTSAAPDAEAEPMTDEAKTPARGRRNRSEHPELMVSHRGLTPRDRSDRGYGTRGHSWHGLAVGVRRG